ncbi:PREDICTED: myotubularin-related protein 3 [Cyprinodon variegatus]|uniref:myotubularin-related protein 3 n=1 Tax=Cyprinodon variegatus TaxID=28743 RepID=UPI0007427B7E|nr:PREDICTED: myotubularin-related protein 3 [Cyprinodon variegatus]
MEEEGQQSLECIQANQIFPKKSPVLEEENMQVPFPELHGEFTEYVGRAEDAIIAISNYRLHIKFKESIVNVPLQLIECVEVRDMFQLHVTCKDCKVVRCQFSTFEQCQEWLKRLNAVVRPPSRLEDLFSFAFHAWCMEVYAGEKEQHGELCRPGEHVTSWFKNEVERMGFDTQNAWRISDINSKFRLCPSYPQQLLVPAWITDKELENVAAFRSWKRFPAVVYRHQSTGAVIARCGQPEVSWWGWRNADDEHLVQSIAKACAVDGSSRKHLPNGSYTNGSDPPDTDFESSMTNSSEVETLAIQPSKLLILDARSYAAAVANRAKGGGCECPEYYPNCEVVFMGMANIHSIRKSFQSLRFLCTQMPDPAKYVYSFSSSSTASSRALDSSREKGMSLQIESACSPQVLHPVCHVRNLMLWTAVYLPSSSPTTPSDDSCAPYPVPGANPEDAPLGRRTKTRSFDNLPSACELGSALAPNRRSSDPSLNEKWQDHRRSLDLNMAVGPEGGGNQEPQPNAEGQSPADGPRAATRQDASLRPAGGEAEEAELSVVVGVAEGQMENILQEATEESGADSQRPAAGPEGNGEPMEDNGTNMQREAFANGHRPENGVTEAEEDGDSSQKEEELHPPPMDRPETPEGDVEQEPPAAHRTFPNGFMDGSPEQEDESAPEPERGGSELEEQVEKRASLMESSTETLTEEACSKPLLPGQQSVSANGQPHSDDRKQHPGFRTDKEAAELGFSRTLNGATKHASISAFQSASAEPSREELCNGDGSDGDPNAAPHWSKGSGERAPLSRQVSLASCNSLILHPRGSCSQHRWCHALLGRAPVSPEQPARSHLDDDGLTLHTDAIQQRLRQIEAGHQMEVETLKKQVQELWSRLESQQHGGSHRINGDVGDEMTSMTDSEFNLDPNCLSRCSTELFSEASWEQVDKQDTEVTRWYPDHLAAQCYGCESRFWLATRKHHCSGPEAVQEVWNCGNVFCASCCDQKIPVPSQQLFEPSRVCKNCYSSLQLGSAPLDHELEKRITASSN